MSARNTYDDLAAFEVLKFFCALKIDILGKKKRRKKLCLSKENPSRKPNVYAIN